MRGLGRCDTDRPYPPHPTLSPSGRGSEAPCLPRTANRIVCSTFAVVVTLLAAPPARAAEPTPEQIEEGVSIYEDFCAMCHGRDLINPGGLAFDLRKFPKDDFARFRNSVLNGKGGMPAWRDKLSDEDITLLWAYIGSSSGN
jgi:mono/diheme cytochrome c family protein